MNFWKRLKASKDLPIVHMAFVRNGLLYDTREAEMVFCFSLSDYYGALYQTQKKAFFSVEITLDRYDGLSTRDANALTQQQAAEWLERHSAGDAILSIMGPTVAKA